MRKIIALGLLAGGYLFGIGVSGTYNCSIINPGTPPIPPEPTCLFNWPSLYPTNTAFQVSVQSTITYNTLWGPTAWPFTANGVCILIVDGVHFGSSPSWSASSTVVPGQNNWTTSFTVGTWSLLTIAGVTLPIPQFSSGVAGTMAEPVTWCGCTSTTCSQTGCSCVVQCVVPEGKPASACGPGGISPICFNIDGKGWDLTDAQDGVWFDFFNTGQPIKISWTAAGSSNAWLALDRNHDGLISSGYDLFGNITAQPPCAPDVCNGFRALAVFDSNGDGVIDAADAIWPSLLLWFDENHDGISEPGELISIADWNQQHPTQAITGISLDYQPTNITGINGNQFRFCAPVAGPGAGKVACDVFLVAASLPLP